MNIGMDDRKTGNTLTPGPSPASGREEEEEAVEWFLRVESGNASVDELTQWQQWMERSPAHRAAYESIQRTWHSLDSVDSLPWPTDAEVASDRTDAAPRAPLRRAWKPFAAAACIAALAASVLVFQSSVLNPGPSYRSDIATDIAEHRQLRLPDGSRMQVGAHTQLKVDFSHRQRLIRLLSGEAFFTVEKDPTRPFVVEAGSRRVTAVGTAFNVRRYDNVVTVEVAEGEVRLDTADATFTPTELRPGQEAMVDGNGTLQPVRQVPAEQVAAWRGGQHRYIDAPLDIVIADLNRYATLPVKLDEPAAGALRITTTFFSDDWEGWLETLETAVPSLQVRRTADSVHISMR